MVNPPPDLPGLDPAWSRWVQAPDADGIDRRWHLLEVGEATFGTMLLVHGNPTWSYLWRRFLAAARPGWRVIAVDQLGMGWSERPSGTLDRPRGLAARIDDLDRLTAVLGVLDSPVVAVGHDWGGIVAAGWAARHADRIGGLVLGNTAVSHDFSAGLPAALRLARHPAVLRASCVTTPAFVRAATAISTPRPDRAIRAAYAAPYRTAADRSFVGQFVADIPLEPDHPTRETLAEVADGLERLREVPALLLRGPRDPVFGEVHLRDLRRRLPQADVQRYEGASHLVVEDAPAAATDVWDWVGARVEATPRTDTTPPADTTPPPVPDFAVGDSELPWARLLSRAAETPDALAVAEVGTGRRTTFAQLETLIEETARGLRSAGIAPGDRVALLVPPGIELTVVVYACWRVGTVIVVADKGLGLAGMGRALRGAGPAHVIGRAEGLAAARGMRVPGQRILVAPAAPLLRRLAGVTHTLDRLRADARDTPPVDVAITGDTECAILFTSGATGPSKGVVYRVDALRTMIGHIGHTYGLGPQDRLVAAFAPFALYGPALGIGAVVPDVDVTRPGSLTAIALADAVAAADATAVFASPAALRSVVATAGDLDAGRRARLGDVRLLLSAGAPVPSALLRAVGRVLPHAAAHTPYGMTEALPVADIDLPGIEAADADGGARGVCVGHPLTEVQVAIRPFREAEGEAGVDDTLPYGLTVRPDISGEIVVRGAHVKDRYDQLWRTQHGSSAVPGWHRTGDVGHLDERGRLWVEGRAVHVVHTVEGPVTPVALERAAEGVRGVQTACVAGVGPDGAQQVVVVLVLDAAHRRFAPGPVAPSELADRVRERAPQPVAAVLVADSVPVDIRHESKIDRTAVSRWAERVLAGGRVGTP